MRRNSFCSSACRFCSKSAACTIRGALLDGHAQDRAPWTFCERPGKPETRRADRRVDAAAQAASAHEQLAIAELLGVADVGEAAEDLNLTCRDILVQLGPGNHVRHPIKALLAQDLLGVQVL